MCARRRYQDVKISQYLDELLASPWLTASPKDMVFFPSGVARSGAKRNPSPCCRVVAMTTTYTTANETNLDPALERRLERLGLTGHEEQWTDRYLLCNHLVDPRSATSRQQFE